ncbi:DUF6479 family protein [Kitasatospora sp. NPDC001540]|uniref:DUF6479 family protein n=1 Tax=Kitasatospora sp. NPDC001540 TaxID=3364014 RepID=UPI00369F3D5C
MTVDAVLAAGSLAKESSGPSLLVVVVPALIIVAALIGAFVWGSRRRRRPPAGPGPAAPRADSWSTPEDDSPGPGSAVPPRRGDGPADR